MKWLLVAFLFLIKAEAVNYNFVLFQGNSTPTISVEPIYSANGANWNDYVSTGTDTACVPGGAVYKYTQCEHGGELKKVVLSFESSCSGLSITESLGVFNWECIVENGKATFKTTGFATGKGLADLVNATSWKNNFVTVNNTSIGNISSSATSWWSNTVQAAPDASSARQTLGDVGTIYTISGTPTYVGFKVTADKSSLVVLNGAALIQGTTPSDLNLGTGGTGTSAVFISVVGVKHSWIEGDISLNGNNLHSGLALANGPQFFRIHNLNVSVGGSKANANENVVNVYNSKGGKFTNTTIDLMNLMDGILLDTLTSGDKLTQGNYFENIKIMNAEGRSIVGSASSAGFVTENDFNDISVANSNGKAIDGTARFQNNKFVHLRVSNSARSSSVITVDLSGSEVFGNIFHDVLISSGDGLIGLGAVGAVSGGNTTVTQATLANSSGSTVRSSNNITSNTFHNIFSVHSAFTSLGLVGNATYMASGHTIGQYVGWGYATGTTSYNRFYHSYVDTSVKYTGNIIAIKHTSGSPHYCYSANSTGGLDGSCIPLTGSDATVTELINGSYNWETYFYGKVSNDSQNTTDDLGPFKWAATGLDWFNFENEFRSISKDGGGATLPSGTYRGMANNTTVDMSVFDWRLKSTSPEFLNKSADGVNANPAVTNGASCPDMLRGDNSLWDSTPADEKDRAVIVSSSYTHVAEFLAGNNGLDSSGGSCEVGETCHQVYLKLASEKMFDGVGDDDGLCESGEACIYTPNFGAYQGHGNLNSCNFVNGTGTDAITGVTMYFYESNGV